MSLRDSRPLPLPLLPEMFRATVARHPGQIAIDIPPGRNRPARQTLTYAELDALADAIAARLGPLLNGAEAIVGLLVPRTSPLLFAAQLGVLRAGGAYTCLDPGFPDERMREIIGDAAPAAILADAAGLARLAALDLPDGLVHDIAALAAPASGAAAAFPNPAADRLAYVIYTSGTTGKPKGVQRDTGGYAVALALSMRTVFDVGPGQVMFSTSDVGWVVGHSYIVYGPLIVGATTIVYEGLPTAPDPGIWWELCAQYGVRTLFSSPTAVRVLKKQDPAWLTKHDLSALKWLFLAGEPLDEPTARWINDALGVPVIDNYWQTETGWPVLCLQPGLELKPTKFGSPGLPNLGFNLKLINEVSGEPCGAGEKGVLAIVPPLPPGCLSTVWGDDARFLSSYFSHFKELLYSSLDWAIRDEDGYYFILGRTDDVINVAGHRLGTREIEESVSGCGVVAEAAVIGAADELKGQVPVVFATLKGGDGADRRAAAEAMMRQVVEQLGAVAKPARVYVVDALPKTRSGKLLRRSLQALVESRDPGDLSTLDDPSALEAVRAALLRGPDVG